MDRQPTQRLRLPVSAGGSSRRFRRTVCGEEHTDGGQLALE